MKSEKYTLAFTAAAAAAITAGFFRSKYEKDNFVVEEIPVFSKKLKHPYTLVFLTDLHDKEFGPGNSRLLRAVRSARPDAALIGGDTMIAKPGRADLAVTKRLLDALCGICPVYYGNGNHEQRLRKRNDRYKGLYRQFCQLICRRGIVYLSDRSALIGDDLRVSGLDIPRRHYRSFIPARMSPHDIKSHIGPADRSRFQILLAHSPLFMDAYMGWGADLTLSGHFHGGTIRLPLLGGVMTPQYQFFLPCCAGTFEQKEKMMVVGRGLGTHSINIRIGNKPQLIVLKLKPLLFTAQPGLCRE